MKTLWKIYFLCMSITVGMTVVGIIIFSFIDKRITLTNEMIVVFPFFIFAITGLYGFHFILH